MVHFFSTIIKVKYGIEKKINQMTIFKNPVTRIPTYMGIKISDISCTIMKVKQSHFRLITKSGHEVLLKETIVL